MPQLFIDFCYGDGLLLDKTMCRSREKNGKVSRGSSEKKSGGFSGLGEVHANREN